MDYISQIFLDKRDVLRIYLAQINKEDIYLDIAKKKNVDFSPILIWDDFIKEDVNLYINKDIYVLYSLGYVYIIDFKGNYIKYDTEKQTDKCDIIYIYDIESFNELWLNFHKLFAEFYVGDKTLMCLDQKAHFRLENNIWITVPMNGIAIYTPKKKLQRLSYPM